MSSHVSASQVTTFKKCKRKWFFEKVLGFRSPATKSQDWGLSVHGAFEYWIDNNGAYQGTDPIIDQIVETAVDQGYVSLNGVSEAEFLIPTYDDGPMWLGYIDYQDERDLDGPIHLILDFKTTSDLKWAKTQEQLATDTQMMSYAKNYFLSVEGRGKNRVLLAQLFIKSGVKRPQLLWVEVTVTREQVEDFYSKEVEIVRDMVQYRAFTDPMKVPPTLTACGDYGGCPFREKCGFEPTEKKPTKNQKDKVMSVLSSIKKKKQAAATPAATGEDMSLLPPDAMLETPVTPKGPPAGTEVTVNSGTLAVQGFWMFVDCIPVKGLSYILFDDWFFKNVLPHLEKVAEAAEREHYRLLDFAANKAALDMAITEAISTAGLPQVMVVLNSSFEIKEAHAALRPYASLVVQASR